MATRLQPRAFHHAAYSRAVVHLDGVAIDVECCPVATGRGYRFEIRLQAAGKTAIVDVPAHEESRLTARVREATAAFSRTLGHRRALSTA